MCDCKHLTESELKDLIHKTVREVLIEMGAGDNISDTQRDFIFLREQRLGSIALKRAFRKGFIMIAIGSIPGLLWLIWVGLNQK